jgi:sedoheptulokinase
MYYMYFIGMDIGTTSISGIVLNLEKGTIEIISKKDNSSWIKSRNDWEKSRMPKRL